MRTEQQSGLDLQVLQEQRMKEILDPSHSALLVVDIQNDFCSPYGKLASRGHNIAPLQAVVQPIREVVELFHRLGRPVVWTKNLDDPDSRTAAGIDRFIWFEGNDRENRVVCLEGSEGAEFFVEPGEGDIIMEKRRSSAYVGTSLREILAQNGIKTLFIVGVQTQRCVARTVHDLYDNEPNLHVVVLKDCVASMNARQDQAAIAEMELFYPPVISSITLKKAWKETSS
ncbi:cysteine hydrolase [Candidatus Microgenomates bacterium]|nr:cysteine hydrolase [Candidatus Microgenomates bacterium]